MTESSPKMTVNKLGEYLVANQHRQRQILDQLKYPKENVFGATYYEDARQIIKSFFKDSFNEDIILDGIEKLKETECSNDYQKNRIKSNISSLELVLSSKSIIDIEDNIEFIDYDGDNTRLIIEGVEISVYPDLIVKSQTRKNNYFGALKIHLSKNGNSDFNGGQYIGAMLHQYALDFIKAPDGYTVRNTNCISYDVFSDTFVKCPVGVKTKFKDIEAGCKNIVAIWDSI